MLGIFDNADYTCCCCLPRQSKKIAKTPLKTWRFKMECDTITTATG